MPETFAIQGLADALSDIDAARKHGNPHLRLLGVVLCNVEKRTILARQLLDYVEKDFVGKDGFTRKFDTTIPRTTYISAAQKLGRTLFETEPDHKVTEAYRALAREFEDRLERFVRPAAPAQEPQNLDTTETVEAVTNG
ncbi:MAG TPA: hypothetical protein VFR10_11480 [bacterium]|nr:hypothetical protein [bacterium]